MTSEHSRASDGRPSQEVHHSYCRFCHNACPILVEVEDGRAVRITGDRDAPMYEGYTCVKGRALAEQHYHPERLLHSQKRMPDGSYKPISSDLLMDEVAERLQQIVGRHGPWALASYMGNSQSVTPTFRPLGEALMKGIGSPLMFDADSIDMIGKHVARALHGQWMAPARAFNDPDVMLIFGGNPLVSYIGGLPLGNPGKWLSRWTANGLQLIVVDPRRTDMAKRASLHLQPRPGEDVAILAGMIRVILSEGLYDKEFVAENVSGVDELTKAVGPFTPYYVGQRAGIDPRDIVAAARIFASGQRGFAVASTGPHMSGPGTLVAYLILNLNTLCGRWMRAGDPVPSPIRTTPALPLKAQPVPPSQGWGFGEPLRASGRRKSVGGYPVGALAEEILDPGEGRVRALISCGGNPVAAWPDQLKTIEAMKALELLVQIDIKMSATSKFAHYVVAPKMSLETSSFTALQELIQFYAPGSSGYALPWAQYTHAVVDPPPGSDLIEEWEFYYGIAQRLGLQLEIGSILPRTPMPPAALDMQNRPKTDDILAIFNRGAEVSLDELKAHEGGRLYMDPPASVDPKDPGCTDRLDVGNRQMMCDLEDIAHQPAPVPVVGPEGELLEFRLITRRIQQALNSAGHELSGMRRRYNPAFMHPDDLARLGVETGDTVEIRSERATILGVAEADETVRAGVVSMTHAFGDAPERDHEFREIGSNTGRLLTVDRYIQPYTGQPRMSNVPVSVRAVGMTPKR